MKFNSLQDAEKELSKYSNLTGVIYPVLNKKIWSLFVGTPDETMSVVGN